MAATQDPNPMHVQVSFGPIAGKKGQSVTVRERPEIPFLGNKIVAFDTLNGTGTRLRYLFIGMNAQEIGLGSEGKPSSDFAHDVTGNGVNLSVCELGQSIAIVVEFIEDCTWDCHIFGYGERIPVRKSL